MNRDIKILASMAMALLALTLTAASVASAAQGVLTSDGPVYLDGAEFEGKSNAFTAFGEEILCPASSYRGYRYNVTPHEPIPSGSTTITIEPQLNLTKCKTNNGMKATPHLNGCDIVLHIGEAVSEKKYQGDGDLICPAGQVVDLEVFLSGTNENVKVCTTQAASQIGIGGEVSAVNTEGKIEVSGTITGITSTESGLCGNKETKEAELHINALISGTNIEGGSTEIQISS
jgi:hypothetical protein